MWYHESSHRWHVNKCVWLCANKTLFLDTEMWTPHNFHVSQFICFFWCFPQLSNNVKTISAQGPHRNRWRDGFAAWAMPPPWTGQSGGPFQSWLSRMLWFSTHISNQQTDTLKALKTSHHMSKRSATPRCLQRSYFLLKFPLSPRPAMPSVAVTDCHMTLSTWNVTHSEM